MTPKEKAKKIYSQYMNLGVDDTDRTAKQCTLIAVNEIIEQWDYIDTYLADDNGGLNPNLKYWYDVRTVVNAL